MLSKAVLIFRQRNPLCVNTHVNKEKYKLTVHTQLISSVILEVCQSRSTNQTREYLRVMQYNVFNQKVNKSQMCY
jgi:hypothetical protein